MTVVVEPPATPAPRRSRRRGVLPAAIAGGLVVLLVGGDLTSRQVVQHVMASKMQDSLDTPHRPGVHIGGGPFLPQLLRGRFGYVSLDVSDAKSCQVRVEHAHAEIYGLHRSHGGARVNSIDGTGLLSYAAISTAIAPLKVTGGDNGQITLSVGFSPLGLAATATLTPRIEGNTLVIDPGNVTASVGGQQTLNLPMSGVGPIRVQLRDIPEGMGVQINPQPEGLDFTFTGHDVQLQNQPCEQSSSPLSSFNLGSFGQNGRPT